jgi:hypothetical protein
MDSFNNNSLRRGRPRWSAFTAGVTVFCLVFDQENQIRNIKILLQDLHRLLYFLELLSKAASRRRPCQTETYSQLKAEK